MKMMMVAAIGLMAVAGSAVAQQAVDGTVLLTMRRLVTIAKSLEGCDANLIGSVPPSGGVMASVGIANPVYANGNRPLVHQLFLMFAPAKGTNGASKNENEQGSGVFALVRTTYPGEISAINDVLQKLEKNSNGAAGAAGGNLTIEDSYSAATLGQVGGAINKIPAGISGKQTDFLKAQQIVAGYFAELRSRMCLLRRAVWNRKGAAAKNILDQALKNNRTTEDKDMVKYMPETETCP